MKIIHWFLSNVWGRLRNRTFLYIVILNFGTINAMKNEKPAIPNIIIFMVDDLGWQDVSEPFLYKNGQPVITERNRLYHTPNLESFSASGIKFTQAYAQPVCAPSRVSIMTGQSAALSDVTYLTYPMLNNPGRTSFFNSPLDPPLWRTEGMNADDPSLPDQLAKAGYRTIHIGKAHFGAIDRYGGDPKNIGFQINIGGTERGHLSNYSGESGYGKGTNGAIPDLEKYHGANTHLTEALTLEAENEISKASSEGKPFFLNLCHHAPHAPYQIDPRFQDNYPGLKGKALAYATLIEGTDVSFGEILEKLKELGIAEETLVIYVSDNGGDNPLDPPNPPLRGIKGQLYEGGIRVPMVIGWAASDPENPIQSNFSFKVPGVHDGIVHIRDIYATILSIADIPIEKQGDSFSLLSTLRNPSGIYRPQRMFIHYPHRRQEDPEHREFQAAGSVYRQGPWKLIYNYETGTAELYNLDEDLGESKDLSGKFQEFTIQMIGELTQQLDLRNAKYPLDKETGEPIRPQY
jgi:arylsulfatase A-like enzyme